MGIGLNGDRHLSDSIFFLLDFSVVSSSGCIVAEGARTLINRNMRNKELRTASAAASYLKIAEREFEIHS